MSMEIILHWSKRSITCASVPRRVNNQLYYSGCCAHRAKEEIPVFLFPPRKRIWGTRIWGSGIFFVKKGYVSLLLIIYHPALHPNLELMMWYFGETVKSIRKRVVLISFYGKQYWWHFNCCKHWVHVMER